MAAVTRQQDVRRGLGEDVSDHTTQSSDTTKDVERRLIARYRDMQPWEKLATARALSMASQQLALAGLPLRHPDSGTEELRMRLVSLRLPPALVQRALGWSPPTVA